MQDQVKVFGNKKNKKWLSFKRECPLITLCLNIRFTTISYKPLSAIENDEAILVLLSEEKGGGRRLKIILEGMEGNIEDEGGGEGWRRSTKKREEKVKDYIGRNGRKHVGGGRGRRLKIILEGMEGSM